MGKSCSERTANHSAGRGSYIRETVLSTARMGKKSRYIRFAAFAQYENDGPTFSRTNCCKNVGVLGSRVLKEPQTTRRAKGAIHGLRFGNRIFPAPASSGGGNRKSSKEEMST